MTAETTASKSLVPDMCSCRTCQWSGLVSQCNEDFLEVEGMTTDEIIHLCPKCDRQIHDQDYFHSDQAQS